MSNVEKLASKMREIVGDANVIDDPEKLKAFAVDGELPKIMVSPGTIDETAKVVTYANTEKLVIVPRGNGTKMGAGRRPGEGGYPVVNTQDEPLHRL